MKCLLLAFAVTYSFAAFGQTTAPTDQKQPQTSDKPEPPAAEAAETDAPDKEIPAEAVPANEQAPGEEVDESIKEPEKDAFDEADALDYEVGGSDTAEEDFTSGSRSGKTFGISARYGLFVGLVPGSGLDMFYQFNENWQAGASAYSGSLSPKLNPTAGASSDKLRLSAELVFLHSRYFFGETFYLAGALGQRIVNTEYELRSTTADAKIIGKTQAKSIVTGLMIGNIWTWRNGVFFGIDWIGYMLPLSSKESSSTDTSGTEAPPPALEKLKRQTDDLSKQIGKLSTPFLLVFNIGYAF